MGVETIKTADQGLRMIAGHSPCVRAWAVA